MTRLLPIVLVLAVFVVCLYVSLHTALANTDVAALARPPRAAAGADPAADPAYEVTVAVQTDSARAWMLRETCKAWRGSLSVALYVGFGETAGSVSEADLLAAGCSRVHVEVVPEAARGAPYPVNALRNTALRHVRTTHALAIDVDFWVSAELGRTLAGHPEWLRLGAKHALVVPAFKRHGGMSKNEEAGDVDFRARFDADPTFMPTDRAALSACIGAAQCIVFQADNNKDGHATTDSKYWLERQGADELRRIECFGSKRYEPYVIVQLPIPEYDERFVGYGKNKIQHVEHLRAAGWTYSVMPGGFLVHFPHPISADKVKWIANKGNVHKQTDGLYDAFRKELDSGSPATPLCSARALHRARLERIKLDQQANTRW